MGGIVIALVALMALMTAGGMALTRLSFIMTS